MLEIVGVRFKPVGKIYYFDPKGTSYETGQTVVVETSRGKELGKIAVSNREINESDAVSPLLPVLRAATEDDLKADEKNREKEQKAFAICEEKIKKHKLDMTLVGVEYTFDASKIVFNFVAEGRVDFRELVKDLASVFKTRIELRQIGVRDETKALGGLGMCGRKVCCASFLDEFVPVSVRMAKDQSLSTNPQKISGTCGKLICCLNFEESTYEDAFKTVPRVGAVVRTEDGQGTVIESNPLVGLLRVKIPGEPTVVKMYKVEDVKVIKASKNQPDPTPETPENDG